MSLANEKIYTVEDIYNLPGGVKAGIYSDLEIDFSEV